MCAHRHGDALNLTTTKQADVFVNGKRVLEDTQLVDGDSVVLGFSHYFVVRRRGVDASPVNLTQIRCDVARSRLTKHKRRQHRHLRLENDVTSAMHYVCEANAIGTFHEFEREAREFLIVLLAHMYHSLIINTQTPTSNTQVQL